MAKRLPNSKVSRSRESGGFHTVRLEPVSELNTKDVLALELGSDQEDFLADNASSLEEAAENEDAQPRAILVGNRVIGFLMYDANDDETEAMLYRFMIDRREQGRGYGRMALAVMLDEIRARGHVGELGPQAGARQRFSRRPPTVVLRPHLEGREQDQFACVAAARCGRGGRARGLSDGAGAESEPAGEGSEDEAGFGGLHRQGGEREGRTISGDARGPVPRGGRARVERPRQRPGARLVGRG